MRTALVFFILFLYSSFTCFAQDYELRVSSHPVVEGNDLVFVLRLSGPPNSTVSVKAFTVDNSAKGGNVDYSTYSKQIKLEVGKMMLVPIKTFEDQMVEGDEKLFLMIEQFGDTIKSITSAKNEGTIMDKDIGALSIDNQSVTEGNDLNFSLSLDKKTSVPFVVKIDYELNGTLKSNDFDSNPKYVLFNGDLNEKKVLKIHTYKNGVPDEGSKKLVAKLEIVDAKFGNNLITNNGIGIISDSSMCRYCPSIGFLNKAEQLNISIFGDGSLQKTVQNNEPIAANTAMGFYAIKHFKNLPKQKFGPWYRVDLQVGINIASSTDTITLRNTENKTIVNDNVVSFGNSVLTPLNQRQAFNARLKLYNKETLWGFISGYEVRFTTSNRNWNLLFNGYDSINGQLLPVKKGLKQANANMLRVSAFHDFIPFDKRDDYSLTIRAGWAANWIASDMALKKNERFLHSFLGTTQTFFSGFEFGLGGRFKNINADFGYTILPGNVEGLSGSRIVTTITFVGGVPLKVN